MVNRHNEKLINESMEKFTAFAIDTYVGPNTGVAVENLLTTIQRHPFIKHEDYHKRECL